VIVNLLLALLSEILLFVFGLLPDFTAPDWLTYDLEGLAFEIGRLFYKLGAWFPTDVVADVFVFVGTIFPIAISAFVMTWLWSVMPMFGKGS
jgi:hypothetical protein